MKQITVDELINYDKSILKLQNDIKKSIAEGNDATEEQNYQYTNLYQHHPINLGTIDQLRSINDLYFLLSSVGFREIRASKEDRYIELTYEYQYNAQAHISLNLIFDKLDFNKNVENVLRRLAKLFHGEKNVSQ